MKQYKKCGMFAAFVFLILLFTAGCQGTVEDDAAYHVAYLNKDKTKLVEVPYEPAATSPELLVAEFLRVLGSDSDNIEYKKPIPRDVKVMSYSLDDVLLTIRFSPEYSKMNTVEEVLCRAAVVRTMTQIDAVDCVSFYIGDIPLTDANGTIVGTMDADSFIENPGEQINSIQNTTLTLYFSNEEGDALIKEVQEEIYYSGNIALEKLVIEKLLMSPMTAGAKSALPGGTRLITVSVADGVCYVNFDETFKNQDYKISESVVIYSIVNSLTELSTINKVQISINGDTSGVYRDTFKLSNMYERNLDYVAGSVETVKEE